MVKLFAIILIVIGIAIGITGCSADSFSIPFIEVDPEATETPAPTPTATPSYADQIAGRSDARSDALPVIIVEENPDYAILDIGIVRNEIRTLDPQVTGNEEELELAYNLFPGLTRFNQLTNEIELQLAKGWRVSEDGLTWTFDLREDIYWVQPVSDGGLLPILPGSGGIASIEALRPVYAEDVVFAVRRACDPGTATPDPIPLFMIFGCEAVNSLPFATDADLAEIGVRAVDPYTVEFVLVAPNSAFLTVTSLPQMKAVPVDVVTEAEADFEDWTVPQDGAMVSAGGFVLSPSSDYEEVLTLEKNPLWPHDFLGNVTQVNVFLFDDAILALNRWNRRQLDLIPVPTSLQAQILAENLPKVMEVTETSVFFLVFNHQSEIFKIPELRRAFSAAIDREELIEEVYNNRGYPARHLTPPGAFGAPPVDQIGVGYNVDFARLSMAEGGVTACRFLPTIRYMVSSSDTSLFQAELIRDMWERELGCPAEKIVIEQVPFGELLAMTQPDADSLRPDVWDLGWSGFYPDSADWFSTQVHCRNGANAMQRPCSSLDNDILRAAIGDPALRPSMYRDLESNLFGEDGSYPVAPIYGEMRYYLRQTWLFLLPNTTLDQHHDMLLRHYDVFTINQELKEIEQQQ